MYTSRPMEALLFLSSRVSSVRESGSSAMSTVVASMNRKPPFPSEVLHRQSEIVHDVNDTIVSCIKETEIAPPCREEGEKHFVKVVSVK